MKAIGSYQNGNYDVHIYEDGTKIRENQLDNLTPLFPENIDIKITDYCDAGCRYCHEDSTVNGKDARLDWKFFETLRPYTELAIGGGNPLSFHRLVGLLDYLRDKNIISNITVNQLHFEKDHDFISYLIEEKLIYGLGVSMTNPTEKFVDMISSYPNTVLHVINGIVSEKTLRPLYDKNLKMLILGYKYLRRGVGYMSSTVTERQNELYNLLPLITNKFKVISFDNLAIEQLNVRRLVSDKHWKTFYMGDDGKYTMYIDLVKGEFSKSSTCKERLPIEDDIVSMFDKAKEL